MNIRNPVSYINPKDRKIFLIIFLAFVVSLTIIFQLLDVPLKTQSAPVGIVSFELAGNQENGIRIMDSWDPQADLNASFGLGLDYLYMLSYALTISLACWLVADRHSGWYSKIGSWFGLVGFLAAFFDAIENIALWNLLSGNITQFLPVLAFWCATIKFTLIILGILYALIGWLVPSNK